MGKRKKTEYFKIEIALKGGEIVGIKSLDDKVKVSKEVPSLSDLPKEVKLEIAKSMQHGSMILAGQNSPGWIIIKTSQGYIKIWI